VSFPGHLACLVPEGIPGRDPWIAAQISRGVKGDSTCPWGGAFPFKNPGIGEIGSGYEYSALPSVRTPHFGRPFAFGWFAYFGVHDGEHRTYGATTRFGKIFAPPGSASFGLGRCSRDLGPAGRAFAGPPAGGGRAGRSAVADSLRRWPLGRCSKPGLLLPGPHPCAAEAPGCYGVRLKGSRDIGGPPQGGGPARERRRMVKPGALAPVFT
jgi:hypothetical protein